MKLKKILVILILSMSFLSIIYNILHFNGYTRLYQIYNKLNFKKFHNKDLNVYKKKLNLFISPKNIKQLENLKYILSSILNQEYVQINNITIIVPHNSTYELPIEFQDYVKVQYVNNSYCNNCRGLIQSLLETIDEDSVNITTDGSILFGKDFLLHLILKIQKYPNSVFYVNKFDKTKCMIYQPQHFDFNLDHRKINIENIQTFYESNIKQRLFKNYENNFSI